MRRPATISTIAGIGWLGLVAQTRIVSFNIELLLEIYLVIAVIGQTVTRIAASLVK